MLCKMNWIAILPGLEDVVSFRIVAPEKGSSLTFNLCECSALLLKALLLYYSEHAIYNRY